MAGRLLQNSWSFPRRVAELVELGKLPGENKVMDAALVLDLGRRYDHDAGIVLHKRFPPFLPVGLEGIAGSENIETLRHAGLQESFRLHGTGDSHRVGGVDVEVGICEHGYLTG